MTRIHLFALGALAFAVVGSAALGTTSQQDEPDGYWAVAPPEKRLDVITMNVDGETFEVWTPANHSNQRNFTWLSGPNEDYGFAVGPSVPMTWTKADFEAEIRDFLSMIDPETGYIADD